MKSVKRPLEDLIMDAILAPSSVGISELKANPTAVLEASGDQPVAILNRNKPVGYLLTAEAWAKIHEMLEDGELLKLAEARIKDGKKPVRVTLDDL
jgi:antitoxin StbD